MKKLKTICFLCVSLLLLIGCSPKVAGKIGEKIEIKIFYNDGSIKEKQKLTTKANIKISKVELMKSNNGVCNLKVFVEYSNLGKSKVDFGYSFAKLKDSKGRIFEGEKETNLENQINKMWNRYYICSKPYDFIDCGPGLKCSNSVSFEVPESILEENIYFGFISSINKKKFQSNILLRDNKKSKRNYGNVETFNSASWR